MRKFLMTFLTLVLFISLPACSEETTDGNTSLEPAGNSGNEELTVISARPAWAAGAPFFATELKLWDKYKLTPNHLKVENSAAVAEALAAGEGDIAFLTTGTALTALEKGVKIKILSNAILSDYIVFSFNDEIKTLEDLKGKKVGSWSSVAEATLIFQYAMKQKGIEDFELINVKAPDMIIAAQRGDVDAGIVYDPYATVALGKGAHRISEKGFISLNSPSLHPSTIVVVTEDALKNKKDAVERFTEMHQEINDYANSHTDEASKILATLSKQPVEDIKESYNNVKLTKELDMNYLQELADMLYESDILQAEIEVAKFMAGTK